MDNDSQEDEPKAQFPPQYQNMAVITKKKTLVSGEGAH